MAKKDQMLRLMNIVDFLKTKPKGAKYDEISYYLENKNYADSDGELAFSEKTFQRDRRLLLELFSIEIVFSRASNTYIIVEDSEESLDTTQTIFDNLLLINAYKQTTNRADVMFFEKRQASGLKNMEGLIHAIKNQKIISVLHTKYWEGVPRKKILEPYAVKEFRNRWYLIACEVDAREFVLKTYGLDRITDLEIHKKTFKRENINVEDLFVNSFGIISTYNKKPTRIELNFEPWQGMYVKSLPIHHSQKILSDTDSELKIELTLCPTYDFYQELLTHAERLIDIKPVSVKKEYLSFLEKGISNFKKD